MNFERTLTTDFMQSKLDGVFLLPCALFVTDRAPNGSSVNGHFNKLKKLSHMLVGGHAIYIYHGLQFECCCCYRQLVILEEQSSSDDTFSDGEGITSDDFS